MKKIFTLLFLISSFYSFGQKVVARANAANTVMDARWKAGLNMYGPQYTDTTQANAGANLGIDSCGALIYTYNTDSYWYRACFPVKHWVQVGSGSVTGTNIYNSNGTVTGTRTVDQAGFPLTFENGAFNISHVDSVGLTVNYSWATNPLATWTQTGTAVTTDGVKTRINGNTTLTYPNMTGVEDWHITQTIITNVKSAATQTFKISLVPSWQNALFTRQINYVLAQDSGYINYFTNDGATIPDSSNKAAFTFIWSAGDTLDLGFCYSKGNITATMTNRRNGQQSYFYYKLASVANIANIKVQGIGDFYLLNNFKYYIDEPLRPQYSATGNSITIGSGASNIMYRWMNQTFQGYSNLYIIHGSSFERSTEALLRIPELCHVIRPQYGFWGDGVNDPGSSILPPAYAANVVTWVDSLIANGITPILISCSPQVTNMTTYNDSLQAIATRFGLQYIDVFTLLVDPAGGTNRNPKYNSDGVHFNDAGYKVWSGAVQKAIAANLSTVPTLNIPHINLNPKYKYLLGLDYNNQPVAFIDGISDKYIQNILSTNVTTNGQANASISIGGRFVHFGAGTAGLSDFIIQGNGSLANPNFKVAAGTVTAGTFVAATISSANFSTSGTQTLFNGGTVLEANGIFHRTTSSNGFIFKNINASNTGMLIDQEAAQGAITILQLNRFGTNVADFNRDGGLHTDTSSGYKHPYSYSALGVNDWPTKTHVDSLLALVSGGGIANTNLGAGYRFVVPSSQGIKTIFSNTGTGISWDSTTNTNGITPTIDTLRLATRAWRQKGIDSVVSLITAGSGVTTMGAFGSTPNSNGASISTVTLTLQPADATNPGGVSTTTQTLAGAKTFSSLVNTTADKYSASGTQVVYYPSTFTNTIFLGNGGASLSHTTGNTGYYNTILGVSTAASLSTASFNVAIGSRIFAGAFTGTQNVAAGDAAMNAATSAANNTAIGNQSMIAITSGANNTALGSTTLSANQTGGANTAIGYQVLPSATGSDNTGFGAQTLVNVTTGAANTAFGRNTGGGITTGGNNAIFGDNIGTLAAAQSGTVVIGANALRRIWINSSGNGRYGGSITNTDTVPSATVHVNGSFAAAYVAKTGTYTATVSDYTIECTANTFTVTLPTAVGIAGRIYNIVNTGAGTITIGTTSSQTFLNVVATPTTLTLASVGSYTVQSNGANWLVL